MPDTIYRIDVFASSSYNADGSGEEQDSLGSLMVTTDAAGAVSFAVLFPAPAGLPDVTATATDPEGQTSAVSALRSGVFQVPTNDVIDAPGQPVVFSSASVDAIALQDPDAGPLDPVWSLTLSVTAGTLTLSQTTGLTGTGDGTGSLSYSGPLSAINAALQGLTYTRPASTQFLATVLLNAQSAAALPLAAQFGIGFGPVFLVTTTADSGPGSLRQAILDSNAVLARSAIDFAIPGTGVETITPLSSLPAIVNPVLIDGESQPGYNGTPLIAINGSQAAGGDGLTITGADVTVRGLDLSGFAAGAGIHITGTGATGDWIYGNFLGTDPTGTRALPNREGIAIDAGASDNVIGTSGAGANDAAEENILSGNLFAGVWITGRGTSGNVVADNLIGTAVSGNTALPNGTSAQPYPSYIGPIGGGVVIQGSASGNRVGTDSQGIDDVGEGNLISGNANDGIDVLDNGTSGNIVAGNLIGTNLAGTAALGNAQRGVYVADEASSNAISGNLITDNGGPGVVVGFSTSDPAISNAITGNRIFGNTGQAIDLGDDGVTENSTVETFHPNDFQNFPVIVTTASGQLEGWLGGSLPDTTFRIDVFASATFGQGGAGEADQDLGSLQVTTDSQGRAIFDVPYSPPAGLPVITATATDPQGNTSEVSAMRRTSIQAPTQAVRQLPGEPVIFSSTSGDGMVIYDRDAGPLDPTWSLKLAVGAGTLTLSSTAGLTGSGNGTDSLSYSGPLSALNEALEGLRYTPSPQSPIFNTLSLLAQSAGAATIQANVQIAITNGILVVSTRSDSGPGSLRQAILDSNALTGGTNTIDFAIPGQWLLTIALDSALPPITSSVLIDGTTQPGYAGIPLIALGDPAPGSTASLAISGGNVTIRGLVLDTVAIDPTTGEDLAAVVHPQGTDAQLSLLGSQGQTLAQSDGLSAVDPDAVVDEVLGAGDYTLRVQSTGAGAAYTWTTMLEPASPPLQPLAVGLAPTGIVAGDFTGDGHLDLAVTNSSANTVSVLLGNGDGTFAPQVTYAVGSRPGAIVAGDFTGNGRIDLAVANSFGNTVSVLLGNGDGTFAPQVTYAVGSYPDAIVAGDFTGNGRIDLAVANSNDNTVSVFLGNGNGTFQRQVTYSVGAGPDAIAAGDFSGNGRMDLAVVNSGVNYAGTVSVLLSIGDGTFRPRSHTRWGRTPRASWPTTSLAAVGLTWPSSTLAAARCRCCWATATAPSSPRSPITWGSSLRTHPSSPPVTSRVTAGPTWPWPTAMTARCRCSWATATAPSSPRSLPSRGRTRWASWQATSLATARLISLSSTEIATACGCSWAAAMALSSRSPQP